MNIIKLNLEINVKKIVLLQNQLHSQKSIKQSIRMK